MSRRTVAIVIGLVLLLHVVAVIVEGPSSGMMIGPDLAVWIGGWFR